MMHIRWDLSLTKQSVQSSMLILSLCIYMIYNMQKSAGVRQHRIYATASDSSIGM